MRCFYARQWRFDVGAVMDHVKPQESSSPTGTLHSTYWQTPFVGVIDQLRKKLRVLWAGHQEKNYNLLAGNITILDFAQNF
jgi:hypothetical protein